MTVYRVERCQGASCTSFTEIGTAFDVSFVDTGLAVGASYSYRVRAADGAGNLSAYSNVASASTLSVATVDGRVGAYPFEEGSGTTTADLSGLGNVGTLQGGVTWTTAGQFGKALTFTDGTWVDLGNPGPLQLSGNMTLSAWVKASAFPADDAAIVSKLSNDPSPA